MINNVYLFMEDDAELNFESPKIKRVAVDKRPSYQDIFEYCNEHMKDEVCIVSNADIILMILFDILRVLIWISSSMH